MYLRKSERTENDDFVTVFTVTLLLVRIFTPASLFFFYLFDFETSNVFAVPSSPFSPFTLEQLFYEFFYITRQHN